MGTIFGGIPCNVLRGELAIRIPEKRKSGQQPHNYQTVYSEQTATFHDSDDYSDLIPLLENQALLLASVKSNQERYKLLIEGKLEWGSSLKVNDPVRVSLKDSKATTTKVTPKATAVILYIGPVKGEKGIVFGVEIVVSGLGVLMNFTYNDWLCRSHTFSVKEPQTVHTMKSATSPVQSATEYLSLLTSCQKSLLGSKLLCPMTSRQLVRVARKAVEAKRSSLSFSSMTEWWHSNKMGLQLVGQCGGWDHTVW